MRINRRSMLVAGFAPVAGSITRNDRSHFLPSARDMIRERYFPNVILVTHQGKKVRFYDDIVKGKVLTLNFMFARCTELCPRTTTNLVKVQSLLGSRVGRDIFMYSISLKPREDTPAVLADYAKMHHVAAGWTFLTGDPADIEMLRRRLGFTDPDPARDRDLTNHIGNLRYGNEPRQLWAACPTLADPGWIAEEINWVTRSK